MPFVIGVLFAFAVPMARLPLGLPHRLPTLGRLDWLAFVLLATVLYVRRLRAKGRDLPTVEVVLLMLGISIADELLFRSEVNEDRLREIGLWYLPATQLAFIVASAARRGWAGWPASLAVSWLNLTFLDTDSISVGVLLNFGVRYVFSTTTSQRSVMPSPSQAAPSASPGSDAV